MWRSPCTIVIAQLITCGHLVTRAISAASFAEQVNIERGEDLASAADLVASDLAQAQFDVQDLYDKRASWEALCNLKPQGSLEWQHCQTVMNSGNWKIKQKETEVVSLQDRLKTLQGDKPRMSSHALLQSASDVTDTLNGDLSGAEFDLEQLQDKRDHWIALCNHPLQQIVDNRRFLSHNHANAKLVSKESPDRSCSRVIQDIDNAIARKQQDVSSYNLAIGRLEGGLSIG
jgi:hypothetical protein